MSDDKNVNQQNNVNTSDNVDIYPLSPGQSSLWFIDKISKGKGSYNLQQAWHIPDDIDRDVLMKSIQVLHDRHPELSVTFFFKEGELIQSTHPGYSANIKKNVFPEVLDDEFLIKKLNDRLGKPFDLVSGPLVEWSLFEGVDNHAVLVLRIHHIVFDLWTKLIIINEISVIYTAIVNEQPLALPEIKRTYRDHVESLQVF